MGFTKGMSGNPAGRLPGVPNRTTKDIREFIAKLIDDNMGRIQADLDSLDPKDRLVMIEKLMQYCVPKMQSVAIEETEKKNTALELLRYTASYKNKN